jgi:hypothetical protein
MLQPDAERAALTLARCQQALARRRIATTSRRQPKAVIVERAILTGFCVVYLVSLVGSVVRMVYLG